MRTISRWTGTIVLATLVALVSFGTPRAADVPEPDDIPQAELERFVAAYVELRGLRHDAADQIEGAEGEAQRQELVEQAEARTIQVLESHDLSPERYSAILAAVNENPDFRKKVLDKVEEKRRGG